MPREAGRGAQCWKLVSEAVISESWQSNSRAHLLTSMLLYFLLKENILKASNYFLKTTLVEAMIGRRNNTSSAAGGAIEKETCFQTSVRDFHGPKQRTKVKMEISGGEELEHLKLGI